MAKVKLTKTELKAQKDALSRYQRFLPMLQLKKSQLQMELQGMRAQAEDLEKREQQLLEEIRPWIGLLADESVRIPVAVDRVRLKRPRPRLQIVELSVVDETGVARRDVVMRQVELIATELRTTSQRVNLFEKVKIPECKENIRLINVALGDEQTSAVARGKIAKGRSKAPEASDELGDGKVSA